MQSPDPDGTHAVTRCRYCGSTDDDRTTVRDLRLRDHLQVVVACGRCGHAFAAVSRN